VQVVDAEELSRALPYRVAIEALDAAFRDLDPGSTPPRASIDTPAGTLLLMPATSLDASGVKLVTITSDNPERGMPTIQAIYVVFDGRSQAVRVILDGSALTAIRTASLSAVATDHLARPDASTLMVFGAGVQGEAHVHAMRAVRPIEDVVVASRTAASADRLVSRLRDEGIAARRGEPRDVGSADVVCTCTTSTEPVFDGAALAEGSHVNAVGTFTLTARELDDAAVRDAGIVVETREVALAEAGDLVLAFGGRTAERIDAELQEVVRGQVIGGRHHTVFKSVGLAFEDLAVASAGPWGRASM
jgi:ornithine cyclodeaminase/alanine dehydrogenase-like protein (mu-crystallin family)